jgi:branched-subunit amino acid transport protein
MSPGIATALALATATTIFKGAGPLLLGRRRMPRWLARLSNDLPAPLLAAMCVVAVFDGERPVGDPRLVGLVVAGGALWRRAGFLTVVLLAALATALVRVVA